MKRNEYGINFDEGLPLESDWEFQKLYVPFRKNQIEELIEWIKNGFKPIFIGGQIGSGKSTFIKKTFRDSNINPDISFHFDTEGDNLSEGDYLGILLVGIVQYALNKKINLSFIKLPQELTDNQVENWDILIDKFSAKELSIESFEFRKKLTNKFVENIEYVTKIVHKIIELIESNIERKLLFFSSGIDKYEPLTAGLLSLHSSLTILSKYKTVFEVNAVHLFDNKWNLKNNQKIFLGAFENDKIYELLKKRKGIYANSTELILNNVTYLSGGNPRQALRLLTNYEFYRNNKLRIEESLHLSIKKTTQDFFAFSHEPSKDLINYVEKNKSLSATLFNLPADKDTAQIALYGNWIFLISEKDGNIWKAIVNPIVTLFFKDDINPEEYEHFLLGKYAEDKQISPSGMTFQVLTDDKMLANIKKEFLQTSIENFKLNLTDTLDLLTASLLSENRQDRIIIAYKSKEIMEAVKAYTFSKVFTYGSPTIIDYRFNKTEDLLLQLKKILTRNKVAIYSFVFESDFPNEQLIEVDKIRDNLIYNQILWWIPIDYLSKFLQKWTQLRQLFQIIILEDEIMNILSVQQIEEDIEFYRKAKGSDSLILKNLSIVLEYLKAYERS